MPSIYIQNPSAKYYLIVAQIQTSHCPLKVCSLLTNFWSSLLLVFLLFLSQGMWWIWLTSWSIFYVCMTRTISKVSCFLYWKYEIHKSKCFSTHSLEVPLWGTRHHWGILMSFSSVCNNIVNIYLILHAVIVVEVWSFASYCNAKYWLPKPGMRESACRQSDAMYVTWLLSLKPVVEWRYRQPVAE